MEKRSIGKGIISATPTKGPKKNFRGPMFLSNSLGKVRSRYLGVPLGSCHDICKYGHKHEPEEERKRVIFQRFMANSIDVNAVQNHVGGLNTSYGMKSSGFKLKPSDRSGNPSTVEAKAPSLKNNNVKIPQRTILQLSQNAKVNSIEVLNSSKKKKNQVTRQKVSPVLDPSPVKKNILRQNSSPAYAEITCGRPRIFKEKVASYMKETVTPSSLKLVSLKKSTASLRLPSVTKSVSLPSIKIDRLQPKTAISLKERILKNLDRNVSKSFKMPLDMQNASIYSTAPAHSVIRLKASKFRNVEHTAKDDECDDIPNINETILIKSVDKYMDATKDNFSNKDDGYMSESFSSDVTELSEIEDMKRKQSHKHSEEEGKELRIRRFHGVRLNEDSPLPYKMKFKRGKVIELVPTETGPKRLRFRRGRVIHDSSKCEGLKRVIRRRSAGDPKPLGAEAHTKPISVMLKHQDSHEKKDVGSLFNYVIEETASKLVEARKSKVKALVGAFETVISLQETKARR